MSKKKLVIDAEELPSNSNSRKTAPIRESRRQTEEGRNEIVRSEPKKKIRPRRAIMKRKGLIQNIAAALVGTDENVGGYILYDVLIPAAKNTLSEMVTSGIEMILFGERRSSGRSRERDGKSSRVSYASYYDKERRRERPTATYRGDRFDLSEIYFKDGRDADDVLEQLCDDLEDYTSVSVARFFELAGIDGADWPHEKFGWTNLSKAYCTHKRGGYQIVFPDPVELDD